MPNPTALQLFAEKVERVLKVLIDHAPGDIEPGTLRAMNDLSDEAAALAMAPLPSQDFQADLYAALDGVLP